MNSRFVKAKDNLPSQEIFRAADFQGNAQALLRVYSRVNYTSHLIVNFYRNNFLIEEFFVFLKVFTKVLKNVHSSHQ